jgi:hypothetical protein
MLRCFSLSSHWFTGAFFGLNRSRRPTLWPNPSLQRTPGRSDASHQIMKTLLRHSTLAPTSGP